MYLIYKLTSPCFSRMPSDFTLDAWYPTLNSKNVGWCIINFLGFRDRWTQTCKCCGEIIGNCLANAFRETSAVMLTACSADRELQNQSSCLGHHSSEFLCTLQELTLSAGMPLTVWKCFSFYHSFLVHSFKAECKLCSFSLCFSRTNPPLTSPEMMFHLLKDSSQCSCLRQSPDHWLGFMEYICLDKVNLLEMVHCQNFELTHPSNWIVPVFLAVVVVVPQ